MAEVERGGDQLSQARQRAEPLRALLEALVEPRVFQGEGGLIGEGLEKGDFSCGHVYDWDDMSLCAEWHGHIDPDLFADELAKLGMLYNKALVGCEDNNHGGHN